MRWPVINSIFLFSFRSHLAAQEFYQTFNGAPFNTLEPDVLCRAVWVSKVEWGHDGIPPPGHTELPTCPVCLGNNNFISFNLLYVFLYYRKNGWISWWCINDIVQSRIPCQLFGEVGWHYVSSVPVCTKSRTSGEFWMRSMWKIL